MRLTGRSCIRHLLPYEKRMVVALTAHLKTTSGELCRWVVAYTCSRHEKSVAEQLRLRRVEAFLPVYSAMRLWNQRRAVVDLPLFPSYIFVRIKLREQLRVLEVPGVAHIVSFQGRHAVVADEEIETLRNALAARRAQPHPYMAAGARVRIRSGALRGLEGMVVRERGQHRMVVSVDFITRSVAVELEAHDLESLGPVPNRPYELAA